MEKKLNFWEDQTCFNIAVESEKPDFIAHSTCHNIVVQKWNCGLIIPQNFTWMVREIFIFCA